MAKYNKANGYEADSEVIYGDTDSVMVNFKVCLLQPAAIASPLISHPTRVGTTVSCRPPPFQIHEIWFLLSLQDHGREALNCMSARLGIRGRAVVLQVNDIGRAMELGREAAEVVSGTFVKPIRLEFEKVRMRPAAFMTLDCCICK